MRGRSLGGRCRPFCVLFFFRCWYEESVVSIEAEGLVERTLN